jgi:hypothetical protein
VYKGGFFFWGKKAQNSPYFEEKNLRNHTQGEIQKKNLQKSTLAFNGG